MRVFLNRAVLIALSATLLHLCVFVVVAYLLGAHANGFQGFVAMSDQHEYLVIGENIRTKSEFVLFPEYAPETFRVPLYPTLIAFVSMLTNLWWALYVIQALIMGALVYATIFLAQRVLPDRHAEWPGIILAVSSGPLILTVMGLGSDMLYTLIFTLAVLVLALSFTQPKMKYALLVGALLGLATLTRPVGILASLPVLFGFALIPVAYAQRGRLFVFALIAFVLVLSPWYVRNTSVTGDFFLSTITGYNFAYYNIPGAESFWNKTSEDSERSRIFALLGTEEPYALRSHTFTPALTEIRNAYLREHAFEYGIFHTLKMIPFFVGSGYNVINAVLAGQSPALHIPLFPTESMNLTTTLQNGDIVGALKNLASFWFVTLERLLWAFAILAALVSPLFARDIARRILILFVGIILSTMVLISPVTQARYRVPAEPYIWIGAIVTITALVRKVRK